MSKIINDFLSFTLSSAFAGFVLIAVLADQKRDGSHHPDQVISANTYEYMPPQPCGTITDVTVTKVATIVNQSGVGGTWFTGCGGLANALSAPDLCPILASNFGFTNLLTLTGFGFSIPTGADIKGITLFMNRRDSSNQTLATRDSVIMLVNSATGTPDDKKSPLGWPTIPSNTYATATYGGPNDLWNAGGATWTASAINSPNFGAKIQITKNSNFSIRADIDYIAISVHYTTLVPDLTPPVLTCPNDTLVTCSAQVPVANALLVTSNENLATAYFYKDSIPISDSICVNKKVVYRFYQGTDTCTNVGQCIQRITIKDTIAPTITCPKDTILVCASTILSPNAALAMAMDNCTAVSSSFVKDSLPLADSVCINKKTIYRVYLATDTCGNTARCIQQIRYNDTIAPTITCPKDTILVCASTILAPNAALATVTDNCSLVLSSFVKDSVPSADSVCINKKTIYRVYLATDTCRNTTRCIQRIRYNDSIAPTITCPKDTILVCASTILAPNAALTSVADNCTLVLSSFVKDSVPSADSICINKKTIYRIYMATDTCRNTARCIQRIRYNDTIAPTITCPKDTILVCASTILTPNAALTTVMDNCTLVLSSFLKDSVPSADSVCINKKIIYRVYLATDTCRNTARCIQKIRYNDTIAPTITCPKDTVLVCASTVLAPNAALATVTDNCTLVLSSFVKDSVPSTDSICINKKTIYRVYLATDTCRNTARCIQRIRYNDTIAPTITCPKDTILLCASTILAPNTALSTVTDNCTLVISSFVKDSVPSADSVCINKKTIYRVYLATDTCRNTARCIQTIRYNDTIAPTITCPNDTILVCASTILAPNAALATVTDNCTLVLSSFVKDSVPASDSICINKKTIYRIYLATDTCRNTARCIQSIRYNDSIAPTITCPKDTILMCASTIIPPDLMLVTAMDNCSLVLSSFVKDSVPSADSICRNKKTIYRIYQATDTCRNTAQCIQKIQYNDTIAPIIPNPGNVDTVQCGQIFDIVFPVASDNCDAFVKVNSVFSVIDSTCPGNYTLLMVFTATDSCGNTTELRDSIVKIDTIAPKLTCPEGPDTIRIDCGFDFPAAYSSLDSFIINGGIVSDACCLDSVSFIHTDTSSNVAGDVVIVRTYKITDCCGLIGTCTQVYKMPACFLDLALKKEIDGPVPFGVSPGGIIPFRITVYNQFVVPADSIKVIDYLPTPGSSVITSGWINNNNGTACITLSRADGSLPSTGLLEGDSVVLHFNVQLGADVAQGIGSNTAEIFSAQDTFHNHLGDVDSHPNSFPDDPGEDDVSMAQFLFCDNLTCIDHVNGSLDDHCEKCFVAADFLKGILLPDEYYTIELYDASGKKLATNCVGRSWLGYKLTYKIVSKAPCQINSCWGTVTIEDKYPPSVGDSTEYRTCFDFANLPRGSYKVPDNCADSAVVTIVSESFTDYGCDSALYQGLVTRHLVAKDAWGNQSDLNKKIYILKLSLDSVVCARDTAVDCSLEVVNGVRITDPKRSGAPQVKIGGKLVSLWPNNPSCKLEVLYKDERQEVCGTSYKILRYWTITDWCSNPIGRDTVCRQIIEVIDTIRPVVYDTILPEYSSSPHDCGQYVDLPLLRYSDCNTISETYLLKYYEEGILRILSGTLPASHIWLPIGANVVEVNVTDACNNIGKGRIFIKITDNTPPTPVCDEYTQVTVDPTSCWSAVAAADLDNGSHDICCSELHFAAAPMDSITYWSDYWNRTLESEVGKEAFWKDKAFYDKMIESWINCYVFSDTVHFDECGTNRIVLRVYEACGMPRLDAHIWPCSPHAWYCYNNYSNYLGDFNWNWFDAKGNRSCSFRVPLLSITKTRDRSIGYLNSGYFDARFGAKPFSTCGGNISAGNVQYNIFCRDRLYNDCMVNVLVDDKQAPVVDHLEDVTVYCDGAPDWADYPKCDDMYPPYPGELRDSKGVIHGYYGGSSQYDVHMGTGDHNDPQACDQNRGWAPIYCKNWLYLDSFDRGGKVNLSDYFEKPVLVDKKRPLDHSLKASEFTFTDNCGLDDASLTVTNNGTINGCGEGWISRTWTIKDKCGNAVSATQKIIVKHRSDFEVIFPADKKVTCDFLNRTDTSELGAGKPKLSDDDCEQLGVTYKDEIFTIVDSACYKIVRTWTIIDWCIYNPNQQKRYPDVIVNDSLRANTTDRACVYRNLKDNNDGYMQYVQLIKVIDELKPNITSCSDQTVCIDKDCATSVNIPLSGTDNCSDQIRFRADITRPDGTHDKRSDITAITGSNFTAGIYKIQVIAKDQCGNEDTCNMTLTIKDCKKPTPYCLNGIATVVMPSTGSIEVWAKDFDRGASDNCTDASKLKFSFTKNTADASKVLTCANIPNGVEQPINVEVWVTDEAGNQDFCSTYILLQDNDDATNPGGVCKDTAALVATVTGKLLTEEKEGVEFANVDVKGMQGVPSIVTSTDGSYSFSSIPMNTDHVSIKALRDDNPMNGVSTLDLVLIQKHILGTESLKSPYKMIAADVDNSNDISAIDLLELRKLILGLYDKLPHNTSWKFIPKSYTFSDASNPWSYPTEDVLTDMSEKMIRDFVGVKIGDVNSSAAAHNLMGTEIRSGETGLIFEVQDQVFKAGDKVSIEFRSPNFKGVSGFQGTLSTSYEESSRKPQTTPSGAGGRNGIQTLKFESISSSISLKVSQSNIGRRWEHEGMITMSWNTNTSMDLKDDAVLFKMNFTAQSAGRLSDVLRIGSQHTIAESYQGKGELGNLSIRFVSVDGKEVAGKSELYQNYPNPFDQRTVIGINLAEEGRGTLRITDITGRTIKSFERNWSKGYNELWVASREISASGVLYYSFESKSFTSVKKMVILK